MRPRARWALPWLGVLAAGAHAAALDTRLDRAAVALGEPVTLTLTAPGRDLGALDTAPLDADFDVFSRTLGRAGDDTTLVLTLYPRVAGRVRIPSLPLAGARSAAQTVTVSDGSDAVPRVRARWTLTPAAPVVTQPARLTLAICDDGSLQWQRPLLPTASGRVLRALGETQDEAVGEDGKACTLHRFHWALLATRPGAATLALPMLDAGRFGQRLRFPGPALVYRAGALPAWLPAHVPPVAPHVEAASLPSRWPLARPLAQRVVVTGGYSADGLKALLAPQLRDTPALASYPPLIETVAPDAVDSPLTRHVVTLFWRPRRAGAAALPTLRLPWFDPGRGRLESAVLGGARLTVFDPRVRRAAEGAAGLAAALLLTAVIWQLRRSLGWRLARRRGLRAIRAARDPVALAAALRRFSLAGRPPAPSLGAWRRQLREETAHCDPDAAIGRLEQQLFGRAAPATDALRADFLRILARARPRPRCSRKRAAGRR